MVHSGMPTVKCYRGKNTKQGKLLVFALARLGSRWLAAIIFLLVWPFAANLNAAETVHVAAASNFATTLKILKHDFESHHDARLVVSTASTGKIYAQLINGAPFDVFLAADQRRPELLVQSGLAKGAFTYAIGQLVAWHPNTPRDSFSAAKLTMNNVKHIAIANPKIAPYGLAAQQWLVSQRLWTPKVKQKLVRGENVAQALQFVQSGHAQVGLVALSDVLTLGRGDYTLLDPADYAEITQQAVWLNSNNSTLQLIDYLRGPQARQIIAKHGYRLP